MGGNSSSKLGTSEENEEENPPRQQSLQALQALHALPADSYSLIRNNCGWLHHRGHVDLYRHLVLPLQKLRFNEGDIKTILNILANHASKWKEIGIALGFAPSELKVIQSKPDLMVNAPNSFMIEMLTQWVQWTPETRHGKYATLEDLVKTLRSRVVGLAAVAEEMIKAFSGNQHNFTMEQSPQAANTGNQGQLDSSELLPLYITSNSSCKRYVFYLRCYYTRSRELTGKWPDIEVREYIDLAVISSDLKYTRSHRINLEQFRKATIHGSIDDILEEKAPILFSDIFKPNFISGKQYAIKRILMEGAPGIGKSTMSWEVCRKWGNGELFQEFFLVVMLRFRDPWVQQATCLDDLFLFPGEPETQNEVVKQIKQIYGEGVLLILEGFDEAPPSFRRTNSLFFQLIRGFLLPNATVMVTTRPSASVDLHKFYYGESSRRVEVLGFGNNEIKEYIDSQFDDSDEDVKADFFKYLELYPHIYSMMYVPLNCAIVTHVYQSCKTESTIVPQTMTQLYTSLVKTLLLRYMKEIPEYEDIEIDTFSDLPQPVLKKFDNICKLAYDGIVSLNKKIIFSGLSKQFDTLGLMQSVPELYIDKGASVTYNFLHLTIQEYLAAYHLSQRHSDECVAYFLKHKVAKCIAAPTRSQVYSEASLNATVTHLFLAGLKPSLDAAYIQEIISEPSSLSTEMTVSTNHLHLLFELHNPRTIRELFKHKTVSFDIENCDMQLFDYYVLGYCISVSRCHWKFRVINITFSCEEIEMLTKGIVVSLNQHTETFMIGELQRQNRQKSFHTYDSSCDLEYCKALRALSPFSYTRVCIGHVPFHVQEQQPDSGLLITPVVNAYHAYNFWTVLHANSEVSYLS